MRYYLTAIALALALYHPAAAQDRRLLETLRVGYSQTDSIGNRIQLSSSLGAALRRKGFIVEWQEFSNGFEVVYALDAGAVDVALDVGLSEIVTAKREHLKMVLIAELRSIAALCCDLEEIFSDQIFKRYTLSSEYLADYHEDVLLLFHQEMIKAFQEPREQPGAQAAHVGPIPTSNAIVEHSHDATQEALAKMR